MVLVGRRSELLDEVAHEIAAAAGEAVPMPADVIDRALLKAVVENTVKRFFRLDLAFSNAGGHADFKPIHETPDDEADWVIDLNFRAVYWGMKYQAAAMIRNNSGVIINNASIFGLKAMPGISHYVAAKHAITSQTRAMAMKYAKDGIRVNAVCPGGTETPNFLRVTGGDAHAMDAIVPMGRIGPPDEVAEAVVWLISPHAQYVTGACLSVDGGMSAG